MRRFPRGGPAARPVPTPTPDAPLSTSLRPHRARLAPALGAALVLAAPAAATGQAVDVLVVANKREATATIVDAAAGRTLATLPTGEGPHEVAVSPDGRWALVTDYGAQTPGRSLTLIDLDSLKVARTIDLGEYRRPHGVAFLPGGRSAVVTSEANQALLVVDVAGGRVERAIPTGQGGSHMVAVTADGRFAYTANIGGGSITEFDLRQGRRTRTLPVAGRTEGIAVTPDGREVWVGSNDDNTVTVIDTRRWAPVDTIATPGLPYRVNMSPDGRTAVVSNPEAELVRLVDVRSRLERAAARTGGGGPVGGIVARDGRHVYVALQNTGEVAMVELATGRELRRFPVGQGPDGIAVATRRPPAARPSGATAPPTPTTPTTPTTPSTATSQPEDERAVLAVVTRLFDAMRARDTATLRAAFAPGASLASTSVRNGQPVLQRDSVAAFVRSIGSAPAGLLLDERLRDPQVRVSDGLASVWVEYAFYAGERFSHCGVNAFHLARTTAGWQIVNLIDTRRREGCPGQG